MTPSSSKRWSLHRSQGGSQVRPEGVHVFASGDLGVSVGFERGHVLIGGRSSTVHARATNIFRREEGGWRMIGHHTHPHVATEHEAS